MIEFELKYGCNPNQKPARIYTDAGELPIEVLNGKPGYINFLDAFNSYQLARELRDATGLPAAASFKHVSPAGAAIGLPLDDADRKAFFYGTAGAADPTGSTGAAGSAGAAAISPLACAYIRARGADRVSSYGDWAALSDICDKDTASALAHEVSDGVIAPGYTADALEILRGKRRGGYNIVKIDPDYVPRAVERKDVYGVTFEQLRNGIHIDAAMLANVVTKVKYLPDDAKRDLLISLITLKYTQSNSVCYALGGQAIGIGAGQQSRIQCTRLAGSKADKWWLRRYPAVTDLPFRNDIKAPERDTAIDVYLSDEADGLLADGAWQSLFTKKPDMLPEGEKRDWLSKLSGVSLSSDAFFPFSDNIERARRSGVSYVAQPGGSIRDDDVIAACDKYGMCMAFTGARLFHH